MADRKHWFGSPASSYVWMIPLFTVAARKVGYALGVHGSLNYDLDLIAAPWTDEAVSAEDLIAALCDAIDLRADYRAAIVGPGAKPHGRRAWTIPLGVGLHLDVSVMPRKEASDG